MSTSSLFYVFMGDQFLSTFLHCALKLRNSLNYKLFNYKKLICYLAQVLVHSMPLSSTFILYVRDFIVIKFTEIKKKH